MDHFYGAVGKNPEYGIVIPWSIALHKFERDHQNPTKPRLFVREYDEDGFTKGFTLNKRYHRRLNDKVNEMMHDLTHNAGSKILECLDWLEIPDIRDSIRAMAFVDRCEGSVYAALKKCDPRRKKDIDNMPPLIVRRYDERGIPVSYAFNPNITSLQEDSSIGIDVSSIQKRLRDVGFDEDSLGKTSS